MMLAQDAAWTAPPPRVDAGPARAASSRRKRAFDILVSAAALLVFLPLLLVCAAAIWLDSGGPVLFRQARGGLRGRPFMIYKFRTMRVVEDGPAIRQVTQDDVRVTRVGRVLRRCSLDELPQLLNVLAGEMSLVGPRPHALAHDAQWATMAPGYADRFRARPGLTGLAQVEGCRGLVRDIAAVRARADADRRYVERWTFGEDLRILLRTVPLVFDDPAAF